MENFFSEPLAWRGFLMLLDLFGSAELLLRCFAQRFFCAAAILNLPSALIVRFLGAASLFPGDGFVADAFGRPGPP